MEQTKPLDHSLFSLVFQDRIKKIKAQMDTALAGSTRGVRYGGDALRRELAEVITLATLDYNQRRADAEIKAKKHSEKFKRNAKGPAKKKQILQKFQVRVELFVGLAGKPREEVWSENFATLAVDLADARVKANRVFPVIAGREHVAHFDIQVGVPGHSFRTDDPTLPTPDDMRPYHVVYRTGAGETETRHHMLIDGLHANLVRWDLRITLEDHVAIEAVWEKGTEAPRGIRIPAIAEKVVNQKDGVLKPDEAIIPGTFLDKFDVETAAA